MRRIWAFFAIVSGFGAALDAMPAAARYGLAEPAGGAEGCWLGDETAADAWATGALSTSLWPEATPSVGETTFDPAVEPAQMQTFQPPGRTAARQPVALSRNSRAATRTAALSGLASVPYMIGDTGAGTCLGFNGLLDLGLAHPTLACGRLNVAEANSAIPTDRIYYSYRHFEDATPIEVYQFSQELDVDRHTLAFERTYWDGMCSFELRTPLEHRLTSDFFSILAPAFGVQDIVVAPNERRTELGNISLIFKSLLVERENLAISAGLGVTLPTAQDVNYRVAVSGTVEFEQFPGLTMDTNTAFQTVFANETVYLLPFAAWLYAPSRQWFHQGFLQVETAANPSRVTAFGDGSNDFFQNGSFIGFYDYFTPIPVTAELFPQTLLRANMGWGYTLWEDGEADRYRRRSSDRLTGLLELHYTTTLQDANLSDIPLTAQGIGGTPAFQTIEIGNVNNRVDILNIATGASLQMGEFILTGGVVAPLRNCPDCGFEVEYNAQVQRLF